MTINSENARPGCRILFKPMLYLALIASPRLAPNHGDGGAAHWNPLNLHFHPASVDNERNGNVDEVLSTGELPPVLPALARVPPSEGVGSADTGRHPAPEGCLAAPPRR